MANRQEKGNFAKLSHAMSKSKICFGLFFSVQTKGYESLFVFHQLRRNQKMRKARTLLSNIFSPSEQKKSMRSLHSYICELLKNEIVKSNAAF